MVILAQSYIFTFSLIISTWPGRRYTANFNIMRQQISEPHHFRLMTVGLLCLISLITFGQNAEINSSSLLGRKYKIGETYRYQLTLEEFHNGNWDHTNVSVCELRVIKDSLGIPYDEVHWISKKVFKAKDSTDDSKGAILVKPYVISLDPKGKIDLPKIEVSEMTEPIQDFNTFFVGVSPLIGSHKLKKLGDSTGLQVPVKADFSNGSTILKGEDCIGISVKMIDVTTRTVTLHASFDPPRNPCLSFLTTDMNTPVVADTLNNFQMIIRTGAEQYLIQYGREMFYINSTIDKSNGKIMNAVMFNKLNLKMKINCDKDYKNCQMEMPFSEQRNLKLQLL